MAGSQLTTAQLKKVEAVVAPLVAKVKDEQVQKNIARYADKWARWKVSDRATGPHSHGLKAETRQAIHEGLREALKIKADKPKADKPKAAAKPADKDAPLVQDAVEGTETVSA